MRPKALIVQLPFPSTMDSDPALARYYDDYGRLFRVLVPEYFLPQEGLWELPLWVAHITALLDAAGLESGFSDLSHCQALASICAQAIFDASGDGDYIIMSPLAQNLQLALNVAERLENANRRVILGGNMAPLVPEGSVHLVHLGQLDSAFVEILQSRLAAGGRTELRPRLGAAKELISWVPDYRHLTGFEGQVPLLRLNASHGCLYNCSFCGDAWSRQLIVVDKTALADELSGLRKLFPSTRLLYIGDKTFGQSPVALRNLEDVLQDHRDLRLIVQTHVMQIREPLIERMVRLGITMVEIGFESADTALLKEEGKLSRGLADYERKIRLLTDAGITVVLNVMGGLDEETESSHELTVGWLASGAGGARLYNLYNFVPYPLIPAFPQIRDRIFDWVYSNWREDKPVVYQPRFLSPARSWELFQEKIAVAHANVRGTIDDLTSPS
jgi:radical SAM superfamily enzyme YgiQ (UPF0313 family)